MKKVIRSSNLSLRCYLSDGWTKPELDSLCRKGEIHCSHPKDADPYFTLTAGSSFICEKLYQSCSELQRTFNDNPKQTDLEFLKAHNG